MCNLDLEIRKLSVKNIFELSQILEIGKGWKELMGTVQNENGSLKYSVEHMKLIELASEQQKRLCSEIFLEEWGTSGRKLPRLSDLLESLKEIQLFRAADYISVLLNEEALERPLNGIEAEILPPTEMPGPSAPPLSQNIISIPSISERLATNDFVQLHGTLPISANIDGIVRTVNPKQYPYKDLLAGTKGFSQDMELGHGGFGSVYKCKLKDIDDIIAVKRLRSEGVAIRELEEAQFRTEVLTLARVSHPNLLPLIGFSCDTPDLCLMYPYMVNGSLQDRIESKGGSSILEWTERYNIALGTAKGLLYLHTYNTKPLVHRDVKSANILLDANFIPKVGDFGLARYGSSGLHTSTAFATSTVVGTSAYMAPEAMRGDVSVKLDVFSFGVVLLELITGLPPFDEDRDGRDLISHVDEVDNIDELLDSRPKIENRQFAISLYNIAQRCIQLEKKIRPDMQVTLELLEQIVI